MTLPSKQCAVQLTGPGKLALNTGKDVPPPGPHQLVLKVQAVGLCFSDLKLLKQFTAHPRKGPVVAGIDPAALAEIPSYRPGEQPTVPGHEAVGEIVAVGDKVSRHRLGERVMVQADWRLIRTATSNAAFGYNFEGALQEYVLLDERVVIEGGTGERYLIPASADLSASAVALVEPWACVESSYATRERNTLKPGGRLLVVVEAGRVPAGIDRCFAVARPAMATIVGSKLQRQAMACPGVDLKTADSLAGTGDAVFDDIIYFGSSKETLDALNDKLAGGGLINVVLGGVPIARAVSVGVGRVHYALTRWIGTAGNDASESYARVPACGEIRPGEKVAVIGAGGPMGQMHVIRNICCGVEGVEITGADVDDARLESLRAKAQPMASANSVPLRLVNTRVSPTAEKFSYFALMAPLGQLVADAVRDSAPGTLINIFAGIPAPTRHDLDLDTYIRNGCYMFGTSGSRIEDMKIVLDKVTVGRLDTNCSVDAVSGMAGAVDGIAAVENRTMAGKIVVYPSLRRMPLTPLSELGRRYPTVADKLKHGMWTAQAERELLRVAD